ncbi:MAG: hypothetical protein RIQ89_1290 [Bacteroidota bacterium]|jgi:glucan phosphoethanolaminetransferase (alkaline phosphatase superfamily)
MLQRIQTIFLLLAVILTGLLLYLPVYEIRSAVVSGTIDEVEQFIISTNIPLMLLNAGVGVLLVISLLSFKNRNLQRRLCNLSLLLSCILIGLLFFLADHDGAKQSSKVVYKLAAYFPLLNLLFIFLASFFIKKDEEMVRSADRLRP